jgi:dipicolinate synthase subunit A
MSFAGLAIAIVGGDRREQEVARCAVASGAEVRGYGFPWPEAGLAGVRKAASAGEALAGAAIALFPIPGIAADGALYAPDCPERIIPTRDLLAVMRPKAHIILGWADPKLKAASAAAGVTLHEYEKDEELMLLRGPAIVEGMLKVVIENTDITIHRARIVVVGQGTIGALVTRTLVALGAQVDVAARNPVQRASALATGAEAHDFPIFCAMQTSSSRACRPSSSAAIFWRPCRSMPCSSILPPRRAASIARRQRISV